MKIYELNKLLSSQNKAKLIAHFWDCNCNSHDVNNLVNKLKTTQSNLSKHITSLLNAGVLECNQKGKERYYKINKKWKDKWKDVVKPQVEYSENKKFKCTCSFKKATIKF